MKDSTNLSNYPLGIRLLFNPNISDDDSSSVLSSVSRRVVEPTFVSHSTTTEATDDSFWDDITLEDSEAMCSFASESAAPRITLESIKRKVRESLSKTCCGTMIRAVNSRLPNRLTATRKSTLQRRSWIMIQRAKSTLFRGKVMKKQRGSRGKTFSTMVTKHP